MYRFSQLVHKRTSLELSPTVHFSSPGLLGEYLECAFFTNLNEFSPLTHRNSCDFSVPLSFFHKAFDSLIFQLDWENIIWCRSISQIPLYLHFPVFWRSPSLSASWGQGCVIIISVFLGRYAVGPDSSGYSYVASRAESVIFPWKIWT